MKRFLALLVGLVLALGALGLWITRPTPVDPEEFAGLSGDPAAGRMVFAAAGCASCHGDEGSETQPAPLLSGGRRLVTGFGTFVTPNISPDPTHGIGGWSLADFAGAVLHGVTPDGRHLYPAMPYTSYGRMTPQDLADLKAYLDTLPAVATPSAPHDLDFPYAIRRTAGIWKQRYLDTAFVGAAPSEQIERGRYLVEALGHCAECHTPRDRFGGLDRSRWMGGADNPLGGGTVPNITPATLDWSRDQIAYYLETGFTPAHQEVGRDMQGIVANLSQLPASDREAIAAYLAGLAPVE